MISSAAFSHSSNTHYKRTYYRQAEREKAKRGRKKRLLRAHMQSEAPINDPGILTLKPSSEFTSLKISLTPHDDQNSLRMANKSLILFVLFILILTESDTYTPRKLNIVIMWPWDLPLRPSLRAQKISLLTSSF